MDKIWLLLTQMIMFHNVGPACSSGRLLATFTSLRHLLTSASSHFCVLVRGVCWCLLCLLLLRVCWCLLCLLTLSSTNFVLYSQLCPLPTLCCLLTLSTLAFFTLFVVLDLDYRRSCPSCPVWLVSPNRYRITAGNELLKLADPSPGAGASCQSRFFSLSQLHEYYC